jgi:hypothetical protein
VSSGQIDLSWVDNSLDEEGFELERSLDETEGFALIATLDADATSFSDQDLVSGATYFYRIRSFNPGGYSTYSNTANARTLRTILVPQDFPTITEAMSAAEAGETIFVSEGTYTERITIKPGVQLLGADPQNTIIDAGGQDTVVVIIGDAVISGFTIQNSGPNHWDAGIWVWDGPALISRNRITANSMGIVLYCNSPCSEGIRIENNVVFNNRSDGILAHDAAPLIVHNTSVGNGINGIVVDKSGTIIWNNISSGNGSGGIAGNNVDIQSDYNNVWNNPYDYDQVAPGPNDIHTDPGFVSSSAFDFHLKGSSPNIDAGMRVDGVTLDIDGDERPYDGNGDGVLHPDIGADEYVGPPVVLPLPPSDLEATAVSPTQIDLTWVDNSTDENGFEIERSLDGVENWELIVVSDNVTSYSDSGLNPGTTYHYRAYAFNGAGNSPYSNTTSATTPDEPVDIIYVATGQVTVAGTVTGNFTDTFADDGAYQSIREQESGGQPARRYSYLEHKWLFDIQPGTATTLNANIWATASSDSDTFIFAYSEDDVNYVNMFTVAENSDTTTYQTYALPGTQSGRIYLRVVDSNRTVGNRSLDTVYVDLLSISLETVSGTAPIAPADLTASAISASEIELIWLDNSNDETGFRIERSLDTITWETISTLPSDTTMYMDTNLQAATTYYYRVNAYNSAGSSGYSEVALATTLENETRHIHVGDLDGSGVVNKTKWNAAVTVLIHDQNEMPVAGATITGTWGDGASGSGSCVTDGSSQCTISLSNLKTSVASVSFTINSVSEGASVYLPGENHDPDGDSDGTRIIVLKP